MRNICDFLNFRKPREIKWDHIDFNFNYK
jgi:hypothetical protein